MHPRVALGARHHAGGRVSWRVPCEDSQRQVCELLLHLLVDVWRRFQLDEGLRALCKELHVVGGEGDDGVDGLHVQDVFVVGKPDRSLHRLLVVPLVQLPLRDKVEVVGLGSSPRTLQRLVAGDALILCDERLHRLRGRHRAHCRRGHLRIQGLLLELLDLECGQEVQLFDPVGVLLRTSGRLPRHLREQLRGLRVSVGLPVQLHRLDLLVLIQQVLRVLCQQTFDSLEVVLLREVHGRVPLVEHDASVDRRLHVPVPHERRDGLLAQAHQAELVADVLEQRAALRQVVDQPLQSVVVLEEVVGVNECRVVLRLGVVLRGVVPLSSVGVVIANGAPSLLQKILVASVSKLDHPEPIAQSYTQVDRKILAIDLSVQGLGLVEPLEICGHLGLLLDPVVQQPQPLDELDALVVLEPNEGLLCNDKVQLIQSSLGEQPP
mmetsp:Transcript_129047/g.373396  ORF Transcript_129047/g.373396 Transcript_129047/m.373396 type:complete len:436 (+) Transcript_129047:340-1647(+)